MTTNEIASQRVADLQEDRIRGEQWVPIAEIREFYGTLMVLVALVDQRDHKQRVNEDLARRQAVSLH
jgi:hypothetical protein